MFKIINLKKYSIIKYTTIATLFLISTSLSLAFLLSNLNSKNQCVNSNILNKKEQNNYKYFVKDIEGKINIFENGTNKPTIVLEKPTLFLPKYDQKMLQEGIYINNIKELSDLIEDYDD